MARQSLLSVLLDLNADGFEKGLKKAQRSMRGTANKLKRSGANLTRNVTAPLALIGGASFKAAADFEAGMAKVKAVSGATAGEFKNLRDNALELGRSTRFSAREVSALQLEFSKLGFTADEITQVTGATLSLAQATGSDLAQSAEVAGSTLRAFGLDASETQRVTDVMAASFSSSALDMGSFQDSMKFVAPVAKAAGLSIESTTAMLAQLANNGIKGSAAGTSLRRILSTVGATGGDVKEKLAGLSKEVITLGDAKDEVGRTAQSAFLVLKEGLADVDNLTTSFQNSEGAAGDMAAVMDDTADGALKRMQSAVEGAQITIGNALAPAVLEAVKTVENLATKFSNLSEGTQGFIVKAGMAVAAIGPFKSTLGSLIGVMARSETATKLLAATTKILNTTMRANPFAIVATGIGLLVGGLIMLNSETEEAAGVTDKLAEATKDLSLEERKRKVEDAIENQKQMVELLQKEKDVKQGIVDEGFGGRALKELRDSKAALDAANKELAQMEALLLKINSAAEAVDPTGSGTGTGSTGTGGSQTGTETGPIEITPIEFDTDPLSQAMIQLSEDVLAAQAALDLTGDAAQHADALASAYSKAAQAAMELGDVQLAQELQAQADAAQEVDKVAAVMQNLQEELGLAKLQSEAFGQSFDFVGAQSAALQQAINDMLELGLKPTSAEVAKLIEKMQNLGTGTEEMHSGMVAVAENLGNVFSTMFSDMATAQDELAEAVASGEMTMAEAAVESQKKRVKAARNAALNIARIFLAEALAGVIKESFTKAPPPIAAGIAAAGVATVNALFNRLVSLKEGGMTLGPQLALIGDNPSGKEAVIPLEKMGRFLSMAGVQNAPQEVIVTGKIKGRDIHLTNERNSIQKTRQRGF